jgi:hypothetical protein
MGRHPSVLVWKFDKKSFAIIKTFGLTPFGPRAPRSGRRPAGARRPPSPRTAPRAQARGSPPPSRPHPSPGLTLSRRAHRAGGGPPLRYGLLREGRGGGDEPTTGCAMRGGSAIGSSTNLRNPTLDPERMPRAMGSKPRVAGFGSPQMHALGRAATAGIRRFPFAEDGKARGRAIHM